MSATFAFLEDTGTAIGSPAKGTTRTEPATDVNWKYSGVVTDLYTDFPIIAGNNSYQKVIFGKFTAGTFTTISAGLFDHTAGAFLANFTLKGVPAIVSDATRWLYTTPSPTADATLTHTMTTAVAIATGNAVWFGATGPEATGKAASVDGTVDRYTNYLTTQLQTTSSAVPGTTASITLTLQYNEN